MISIKRNITFALDTTPYKKDKDVCRLRCIVTWCGNRLRLNVGHNVDPRWWNGERCNPRTYHGKNKTPSSLINKAIDDMEERVNHVFAEYELLDTTPSKETIKAAIEPEVTYSNSKESIFEAYDEYTAENIALGKWAHNTQRKARQIKNHLLEMNPNLTFEELADSDFINALMRHFAKRTDKKGEKGLSNISIRRDIVHIKTFIRWAQDRGYIGEAKLLTQKMWLKTARKTIVFLTWDELMRVYTHDFGHRHALAAVRDIFCFCCFTSLRYSDVLNLKRSDFHGNSFTITTIKTADTLTIELNKYSRAIYEKYANSPFPTDKAFPVISNQKMNEALKEIGEICKIDSPITLTSYKGTKRIERTYKKWELLSTHAGRRTFISNAIMLGIPPNVIMKYTGHSDYNAMRPYIEIADSVAKSAMQRFDAL